MLVARRGLLALAAATPLLVSACSASPLGAAATPTDHYRRTDGLACGDGERQKLDLYVPNAILPRGEGEHAPVVVFFYGGSWQRGQRAHYAFVGEALASRGFIVAIDRLAAPLRDAGTVLDDIADFSSAATSKSA